MLFSIIMPVYMVEGYIEKSIQSIVNQTNKDFEVIIVNDGTKDNSIEKAEKILENTDINYSIIVQNNLGLASARNAGLKQAKGDWVICIDSDDSIHPQTLEFIQNIINKEQNKPEVIVFSYVMCRNQDYRYVMYEKFPDYHIFSSKEAAELYLDRKLHLVVPAFCIRREVCMDRKFFYNPKVFYSEDTLYIWNVFLNINKLYYIDEPLYFYLRRPRSIMSSSDISKVLSGYRAYLEFENRIKEEELFEAQKYILPRWILGVMHSTSKYMDLHTYRELLRELNYKKYIKELKEYSNKKVRMMAWIISILKSTSFFILRIR